ncbi:cytochrome b561 [Erwiniaceae bacterium BAC15a-03b]|uniref:Cytochrome b561 n=1 Tax=Winslowiella arboricola TaxID=2978220 RepID=A0A9J6PVQ8_9GAMM|nr:cytochrome b561 [Winslowiella arboricola]MCU5775558.1 cytochrome b561 [Winslowiella arboricola]MCU5779592.1 cytochrome b561 [Winslowiella arboricola]
MKKYAPSQITLHWLVVILLIVTYATIELRGFAERGSLLRSAMMATHFSCGTTILLLMLARIFLRYRHATPPIAPLPPLWQRGLAHLLHIIIYLLFISLPILGLSSRYLRGNDWVMFGLSMPVASPPNRELASQLIDLHETLAPLGYYLIALHSIAALFHHYLLKDNTLLRMMPVKRQK